MSAEIVQENARDVPVRAKVDVLVAGGGLAGVAAATAAARAGANTLLLEQNAFLGGVATAGLCCSIFNCYHTTTGELAVTGIPVEVADALAEAEGYGRRWRKHKGHIIFDCETGKQYFDQLVEAAGAEILYQTVVCGVVKDGDAVRGVIIESKSGREAVLANLVIDATGDSDVAHLSEVRLHAKASGATQTLIFRLANVDLDAFVGYFVDHPDQYPEYMDIDWRFEEALAQYRDTGTFLFPHGGAMQMDIFKRARAEGRYPERVGLQSAVDACQIHGLRGKGIAHVITGMISFEDLGVEKTSRSMIDGRRMSRIVAEFFRSEVPGFANAIVVETAANLGTRISRWLDAEFVFTADMRRTRSRFPDAVGRCACQHDTRKHTGDRAWGVQTFSEETSDIPYGCIVPRSVDGLLIGSGRSVSVDPPHILRSMAHTMVVGQAAGVAGAVAAKTNRRPREVDIAAVQNELTRQGVVLNSD